MFTIKYCKVLGLFFVYIEGEPHETQLWKMTQSQLLKFQLDMSNKKVKFDFLNENQIKTFKLIAKKTMKGVQKKKNMKHLMKIAIKYGNMH